MFAEKFPHYFDISTLSFFKLNSRISYELPEFSYPRYRQVQVSVKSQEGRKES